MITDRSARRRDGQSGITLIEMLVSLVIFAFVGLASFTMLDTLLQVQNRTDGRLETLAQIDRALSVFSHDILQGDPSTLQLDADTLSLTFISGHGHRYFTTDGQFHRAIVDVLDREETLEQLLVSDVRNVTFQVLDRSDIWQSAWPIEGVTPRPRAVRMTLILETDQTVTRLVPLTDTVIR